MTAERVRLTPETRDSLLAAVHAFLSRHSSQFDGSTKEAVRSEFDGILGEYGVPEAKRKRMSVRIIRKDYQVFEYGVSVQGFHKVFEPIAGLPLGSKITGSFGERG